MTNLSAHAPITGKRFELPITFKNLTDPADEFSETCVVDTGCPDAIALPENYEDRLEVFRGTVERGGAATAGPSSIYTVHITSIDGEEILYKVPVICSLPAGYMHSLMGMDLLKSALSCIHGNPDDKELTIEFDLD